MLWGVYILHNFDFFLLHDESIWTCNFWKLSPSQWRYRYFNDYICRQWAIVANNFAYSLYLYVIDWKILQNCQLCVIYVWGSFLRDWFCEQRRYLKKKKQLKTRYSTDAWDWFKLYQIRNLCFQHSLHCSSNVINSSLFQTSNPELEVIAWVDGSI